MALELYPRSFFPDPSRTGGDRPSSILHIPRESWEAAGRPESIEEWVERTGPAPAMPHLGFAAAVGAVADSLPADDEIVFPEPERRTYRMVKVEDRDAAVAAERERVLLVLEGCLEKQRREEHHHLASDIGRAIRSLREESTAPLCTCGTCPVHGRKP